MHVGSGQVRCAHGILPVPAPATALILKGIPIYGGEIRGELCTPTGAALLKHFVSRFESMPPMTVSAIGYGMGKKDFPAANCVRALLGESADRTELVPELSFNVDDMTAEEIGFCMDRLFEGGAFEVFTIPVGMKKNRPGTQLSDCVRQQPAGIFWTGSCRPYRRLSGRSGINDPKDTVYPGSRQSLTIFPQSLPERISAFPKSEGK